MFWTWMGIGVVIIAGYSLVRFALEPLLLVLVIGLFGKSSKVAEDFVWSYDRIRVVYWLGCIVVIWVLWGLDFGPVFAIWPVNLGCSVSLAVIALCEYFVAKDSR